MIILLSWRSCDFCVFGIFALNPLFSKACFHGMSRSKHIDAFSWWLVVSEKMLRDKELETLSWLLVSPDLGSSHSDTQCEHCLAKCGFRLKKTFHRRCFRQCCQSISDEQQIGVKGFRTCRCRLKQRSYILTSSETSLDSIPGVQADFMVGAAPISSWICRIFYKVC